MADQASAVVKVVKSEQNVAASSTRSRIITLTARSRSRREAVALPLGWGERFI